MIGCWRTRVRKQPIIVVYFEPEIVLKLYNLEARMENQQTNIDDFSQHRWTNGPGNPLHIQYFLRCLLYKV